MRENAQFQEDAWGRALDWHFFRGYVGMLAVFRDDAGELETFWGADEGIAGFLFQLASGEILASGELYDEPADEGTPRVTTLTAAQMEMVRSHFLDVVTDTWSRGFRPYLTAFGNEHGHARTVAHQEIDDIAGFLRWLAFEVTSGEQSHYRGGYRYHSRSLER